MGETKAGGKGVAAALTPPTSRKPALVDMKGSVKAAMDFAKEMFAGARDIRLEEVEPTSSGWSVVISYAANQPPTFAVISGQQETRVYKKITIDSESGKVLSLKAWK